MKKYGWIAIVVAALDQIIKGYVRNMPLGRTFFEIENLVSLTHCTNTGAAFSILSGKTMFLSVLSLLLLGVIYVYAVSKLQLTPPARIALACILGGGIGNLLDRLFFGGVTDYIRLLIIDFPVFNLADIAITGAVGGLMILLFTDTLEESSEENHGSDD